MLMLAIDLFTKDNIVMPEEDPFKHIIHDSYGFPAIMSFDDLKDNWDFSTESVIMIASAEDPDKIADNLNPLIEILHVEGGVYLEDVYSWLQDEPVEGLIEAGQAKGMEAGTAIEYMVKYGDEGYQLLLEIAVKAIYGMS